MSYSPMRVHAPLYVVTFSGTTEGRMNDLFLPNAEHALREHSALSEFPRQFQVDVASWLLRQLSRGIAATILCCQVVEFTLQFVIDVQINGGQSIRQLIKAAGTQDHRCDGRVCQHPCYR